jgi:hypothetical protein
MKKNLLFVLVFVSSFSFSQQGFGEIIINTANNQIITRTWDVANGTNPSNVDGAKYFNSWDNTGVMLIYLNNTFYEPANWNYGSLITLNNETIGNGIAAYSPMAPIQSLQSSYFRENTYPYNTDHFHYLQ